MLAVLKRDLIPTSTTAVYRRVFFKVFTTVSSMFQCFIAVVAHFNIAFLLGVLKNITRFLKQYADFV